MSWRGKMKLMIDIKSSIFLNLYFLSFEKGIHIKTNNQSSQLASKLLVFYQS